MISPKGSVCTTDGRGRGDGMNGTVSQDGAVRRRIAGFLSALAVFLSPAILPAGEGPVPSSFSVEEALSNNPSLSAMQERIRMKENAAIRAGALDDPKGGVGITNVPGTSWAFREGA